jgi:hypothetical protein
MSKDLVSRWFNKLGPAEQDLALLILNGMAYTPRQTYDEVLRGSPVGDQLQRMLEMGKFGTTYEEEQDLIKSRLNQSLSKKDPNKPLFVALSTISVQPKAFTPAQLLQEISAGTPIGQQWIKNEADYMHRILQVR